MVGTSSMGWLSPKYSPRPAPCQHAPDPVGAVARAGSPPVAGFGEIPRTWYIFPEEEVIMNIQLTKEQLAALVKLVYLGNRMANDWRSDDVIEEYDEVESLILEAAQKHGLGDYVEFDEETKKAVPSGELEEKMTELVDFYNDNSFWDQLIYRMADRDYVRKFGDQALEELYTEKGMERERPLIEKYEKEFNENGLDRLEVRRDN
jgi:hypothetical protein